MTIEARNAGGLGRLVRADFVSGFEFMWHRSHKSGMVTYIVGGIGPRPAWTVPEWYRQCISDPILDRNKFFSSDPDLLWCKHKGRTAKNGWIYLRLCAAVKHGRRCPNAHGDGQDVADTGRRDVGN